MKLRDTLSAAEAAELLDIAIDQFHDWAWRMGLQEADPDYDESHWLSIAETIFARAEANHEKA